MNKFLKELKEFIDEWLVFIILAVFVGFFVVPKLYLEMKNNEVKYNYLIKKDVVLLEQNTECGKGYCTYKTNYGDMYIYYKEFSKLEPNTKFDLFIKLGTKHHTIYAKVYTSDTLLFNYYMLELDTITKSNQLNDYNFFIQKYNADMSN